MFVKSRFFCVKIETFVGGNSRQSSHFRCLPCWVVAFDYNTRCQQQKCPFQVLFRCPRPLNRGVHLIKVSFKANKGNKFWDFGYCPLNRGCPLNTGFTVFTVFFLLLIRCSFRTCFSLLPCLIFFSLFLVLKWVLIAAVIQENRYKNYLLLSP